jgi:hypothetical protein
VLLTRRAAFSVAAAAVFVAGCGTSPLGSDVARDQGSRLESAAVTMADTAPPEAGRPAPSTGTAAAPSTAPSLDGSGRWSSLRLVRLEDGPRAVSSAVTWSGGAVALGETGTDAVEAWTSTDGRSWRELPTGTFGAPVLALAVRCSNLVLVLTEDENGIDRAWRSTDGLTWSPTTPPVRLRLGFGGLAGGGSGAVAVTETGPATLLFTPDGLRWQEVPLPGGPRVSVQGVAAAPSGYVAVGASAVAPSAWRSHDGLRWTSIGVDAGAGGFDRPAAGRNGFVVESHEGGVPGLTTLFGATGDGRVTPVADPLGTFADGEGSGSSNGLFVGDGRHIVGYGTRKADGPVEIWVSEDGDQWVAAELSGDVAGLPRGMLDVYPLGDVLLLTDPDHDATWIGLPSG